MENKAIGIKVEVPYQLVRDYYGGTSEKRPALYEIKQFATFIFKVGMAEYLRQNDKSLGGNDVGNIQDKGV